MNRRAGHGYLQCYLLDLIASLQVRHCDLVRWKIFLILEAPGHADSSALGGLEQKLRLEGSFPGGGRRREEWSLSLSLPFYEKVGIPMLPVNWV